MSRYHERRRRVADDSDAYDFRFQRAQPRPWTMLGVLLVLLVASVLLLWAVRSGYGIWAVVILSTSCGLLLVVWLVSGVRVALAWARHLTTGWKLWAEERRGTIEERRLVLE